MSGALRYLKSPAGQAIANDKTANVIVILPDGVRNYMSKPWFLDTVSNDAGDGLRKSIRSILGRDLGDAAGVVRKAEAEGTKLQDGEGLANGISGMMSATSL